MLRIGICDDEEAICVQLEDILKEIGQVFSEKLEVEVFFSGEEMCRFLSQSMYFDIIFLDIELDKMNGVEVGKKIRGEMSNEITQIIYISGKENYAMQLFKIRPIDFVIKPLTYEKIADVFQTASRLIHKNSHVFNYQIEHITYKIPIKDILYFESKNRKINIVKTEEINSFYGTLDRVFDKVKQFNFINIHKSYLVNYNHIIKLEYHHVTMSNKIVLPISQPNRKKVRAFQLELERCGL